MAYSVQCRDAGLDCPGSFTTESKEELVKHVELHAKEAHPGLELEPEQVEQLIKTTA
jgi:predicted small metal-binding protein